MAEESNIIISHPPEPETAQDAVPEADQSFYYSIFNRRGKRHRFLALIFMCWLGFGPYFCYDNPSALQNNIMQDLNVTATHFSLLYSLYAWPSVIVCIIGGVLIDSLFGIRLGSNIFMVVAVIGHLIFATGALLGKFWLMAVGRFIFGTGAEPIAIAQNNYAVSWFKDKELNMVFGIQLSCASLGSVANFWVMDPLYNWMSNFYSGYELLGITLFIASSTCIFSLVCSLILGVIDKRAECETRRGDTIIKEIITFKDFRKFHWSFWLLNVICVTYYVAIFSFITFSKVFLMEKFNMTSTEANHMNSLQYFTSVFAAPVLGFAIDKAGRHLIWTVAAIFFTLIGHCALAFTSVAPCFGMGLMSISSSAFSSSVWPMVSLIIPNYQLGTAYGFSWSIQNLFLGISTILSGIIVDHAGYFWLEIYFIASLLVSLTTAIILLIMNSVKKGALNLTPVKREAFRQQALVAAALEQEKLILAGPSTPTQREMLQSDPDHRLRSRYLSKVGIRFPPNYNINNKGFAFRALR